MPGKGFDGAVYTVERERKKVGIVIVLQASFRFDQFIGVGCYCAECIVSV
jgi:hypothetical protein